MFKKGEWEGAVSCYSSSLALRPTAVAYANRAMAFIKMKRWVGGDGRVYEIDLIDLYP